MSSLDIASWTLIVLGALFSIIGGLGLIRLPDFYSRTHAGGLTDTLGASGILIGLALQAPNWNVVFKLLLIILLLYVSSPTATHALVKAAFSRGLRSEDPGSESA